MHATAMPSFDRINLASTFFQATIVVAFAAAHVGATRYFQRRATRALSQYWMLLAAAAALNIVSSVTGAVLDDRMTSRLFTTFTVALQAAAIPVVAFVAHAMAREDAKRLHPVEAWRWGLIALSLHGIGVFGLAGLDEPRVLIVGWSRLLSALVALIPMIWVWRVRRDATENRPALTLLGIGLTAFSIRQVASFFLGLRVGLPDVSTLSQLVAITIEVVTVMTLGSASLLATTAHEYSFEQQQAARLAVAQQRMASGERLESLGRLAASVAHDFNNVLAIVVGAIGELEIARDAKTHPVILDSLRHAADHGKGLVRRLLDFARAKPGEVAPFDATARLDALRDILRRVLNPEQQLVIEAPSTTVQLTLDPTAFEQVLINLVANARDAMPHGGTVTVRLRGDLPVPVSMSAIRCARITVSDTGTGMSSDVRAQVFEPFYTTKEQGRGTGLGLATVAAIVRDAGGDVSLESELGRGTTFNLCFPQTG